MNLSGHELSMLITTAVAGGIGVTALTAVLKRIFKLNLDVVIHSLVIALSFAATAAQYVLQFHSKLPVNVLGLNMASVYGFSQFVYKFASYGKKYLPGVSVSVNKAKANPQAAAQSLVSDADKEAPIIEQDIKDKKFAL